MFPMDPLTAKFISLACKDLPLLMYAVEISQLTVLTLFDDAALNSLFWIRANYYRPIDLPDTTGLSWREAIIRCLESVYLQSRTQPDPEPRPPSLRGAEHKPDPSADREPEPEPVATDEPSPRSATELRIAMEPEPHGSSDQVRKLATTPATKEKAVPPCAALSIPYQSRSPCWESQFGVCGQRTPALKARRLTNARSHTPVPASSTAVVWQPLCSPLAHHLYGASFAGLPSSIVTMAGESLASASSL